MYDCCIIGGGPAAVAAGVYCGRKNIRTLLLTKNFSGQAINSDSIENIIGVRAISGVDFSKALEEQVRLHPSVEIFTNTIVERIEKKDDGTFGCITLDQQQYQAKTIIVATGSTYRKLGVEGEEEYEGKGVFYCSICDAPLMRNKEVVVVGGGNSGLEAVIDLLPFAKTIHLFEREQTLRGDIMYQERLQKEPQVQIHTNVSIQKIQGDGFVTQVVYTRNDDKKEYILPVGGVFVEIGYVPNTSCVGNMVVLDSRGQIIVDHKTMQTSCEGIWAAGDVTDGLYNQINTAIGQGIIAALNVYDVLKKV